MKAELAAPDIFDNKRFMDEKVDGNKRKEEKVKKFDENSQRIYKSLIRSAFEIWPHKILFAGTKFTHSEGCCFHYKALPHNPCSECGKPTRSISGRCQAHIRSFYVGRYYQKHLKKNR
ncbi:hypothetical protein Glove_51g46 [Diversispora epigaea]|uniref:Uncharacterized protein n=1 Tax=Diversispora epigaea TaxID=1348612 RepID=A0A397JN82_9GLOM|nr:hypothetical protein Glove_51g46 [Diversispora epigaea]